MPQGAALDYHADIRARPFDIARPRACPLVLVQGSPQHEFDGPGAGWVKLADVGRPGDKGERFRLYRLAEDEHPLSQPNARRGQARAARRELAQRAPARALRRRRRRAAASSPPKRPGVRYDYSRQRLGAMTLRLLAHLADERGFAEWREALLAGSTINNTENRAAWHTALRAPDAAPAGSERHPGTHEGSWRHG